MKRTPSFYHPPFRTRSPSRKTRVTGLGGFIGGDFTLTQLTQFDLLPENYCFVLGIWGAYRSMKKNGDTNLHMSVKNAEWKIKCHCNDGL